MICYKDVTFCEFFKTCKEYFDKGCKVALTERHVEQAAEIGLPVCQYVDKPVCYVERVNNT